MTEDEILVFETAQIMRGDGDREIGALSWRS
jgi:hypothetical protein